MRVALSRRSQPQWRYHSMRLSTFTVVATLAAGLALPAMAQAPSTSGGSGAGISSGSSGSASGSSSASGASGSSQSFSTSNVDPNMPFGSINISTAGANNANMSTFMAG